MLSVTSMSAGFAGPAPASVVQRVQPSMLDLDGLKKLAKADLTYAFVRIRIASEGRATWVQLN